MSEEIETEIGSKEGEKFLLGIIRGMQSRGMDSCGLNLGLIMDDGSKLNVEFELNIISVTEVQ